MERKSVTFYTTGDLLKLYIFIAVGYAASLGLSLHIDYPIVFGLFVLLTVVFVVVMSTSKVTIDETGVSFKSLLKKRNILWNDVRLYGFFRYPMLPSVFAKYRPINENDKVGLFSYKAFYVSTDGNYTPDEYANISNELIYFGYRKEVVHEIIRRVSTVSESDEN